MIYRGLVSYSAVGRSSRRAPRRFSCEAEDEACFAFAAWCDIPVTHDRIAPWVHPDGDSWIVSDGFLIVKVCIYAKEAS